MDQPRGSVRARGAMMRSRVPAMTDRLQEFLDHLRLNRNASAHTVAAYHGDLSRFLTFAAAYLVKPLAATVADADTLRGEKLLQPRDEGVQLVPAPCGA